MRRLSFVLGYHGCDQAVANRLINGKETVSISDNDFDWLGTGAYFWENDALRALQWAKWIQKHPQHAKHQIHQPAVIGAIIDPGNSLDLTDTESLQLVKKAYEKYDILYDYTEGPLPKNQKGSSKDEDLVKRYLDCAVINFLHELRERSSKSEVLPFDSVRGIFVEGSELYPGAGIMNRTHTQICVRNPRKSILGYFLPLDIDSEVSK